MSDQREPVWRRIWRLHGPDPKDDVREEFAFHLSERVEGFMAGGMSESDARAAALRQFGDIEGATAECTAIGDERARGARFSEWWASVGRDVGYAVRTMRRWPGFSGAAVATIALGVGANAVVFSILYVILLQPLDAVRPHELVRVYTSEGHAPRNERDRFGGSSYADYLDFRGSPAFTALAAYMPLAVSVDVQGARARAEARVVSDNYFAALGRFPHLGSWAADERSGRHVVVSHRFWQTTLEGDSSIIGRAILLNGEHTAIVAGVMPRDFRGIETGEVDLYLSFELAGIVLSRPSLVTDRGWRSIRLIGRLTPGGNPESAEQYLGTIMQALAAAHPASNARRTVSVRAARSVVPLELAGGAVLPASALVFGATVVMLGLAGVNVAAVLLARTIRRRRELALRVSLGASGSRLVRQLATENVVLAFVAGVVVLALLALLPVAALALGLPASVRPALDARVLGYAATVAIAFGLLVGIAPALAGMRTGLVESMRAGGTETAPARARAQRVLVVTQIALSMLLLVVSSALLGSLYRQQRVDPGFAVDGLVIAQFEDPLGADGARHRAFGELVMARLSEIPNVTSVSLGSMAPLTSDGARSTIHIEGYEPQADEDMGVFALTTGRDYFRTLGIPILRGRERTSQDRDSLPRVVVNRLMALRYWDNRNPVGTFVRLGGPNGKLAEVIGVARDARFRSLAEAPRPMYAVQYESGGGAGGGATVLIRTRGDVAATLLTVRGAMARNEVPYTLMQLHTMRDVLRSSLLAARTLSQTLLALGILAVVLAAVGLYGVVSYVTAGRAREFGIRLALGSTPAAITRLVLGYGLRLAVAGGAVGLLLGLGALRAIESMLFGSWAYAPLGLLVAGILTAVTVTACAIPAMRATATSASSALRSD